MLLTIPNDNFSICNCGDVLVTQEIPDGRCALGMTMQSRMTGDDDAVSDD